MRLCLGAVLALVVGGVAFADEDASASNPLSTGHEITQPNWRRLPTRTYVKQIYPKKARARGVTGTAAMRCRITRAGRLENCRIIAEDPPNYGFGQAELGLASSFQLTPMMVDGKAVESEITVPIRFELR